MKKIIVLILISFVLNSCKTTAEDKAGEKIINLEEKLTALEEEKNKLYSKIGAIEVLLDYQKKELEEDYVSKPFLKNIIAVNLEKYSKVDLLIQFFEIGKDASLMQSLTYKWKEYLMYIDEAYELSEPPEFLNVKSRESKDIAAFFNDNMCSAIIKSFKYNNIYKASNSHNYIESLLNVYESLEENDYVLLEELYELSQHGHYKNEEAVNELLAKLKKNDTDVYVAEFPEYYRNISYFYMYSFWARRQQENNMEIVYAVMKKIHTNIIE